ncbi:MAG TPA: aspartate--tRNA(Asn) ligase [Kofleriaceae bacterium]|jgi:nondiscriminating aspartyl-tRNA synthetase|nr:aspartate--tRNA(Asn) ligase [Kofleriaceae bacterium]
MRIRSSELATHVGEQVAVAGWLQSIRRLGKVTFLVIRDGWGTIQAVVADEARLEPLAGAELESVVELTGTVVGEPQVELHGVTVRVVSRVAEPTPVLLGKKALVAPLPALLDHAGVANRHPTRRAVFRLGAAAMRGFRRALDTQGFVEIQSPKLVESATEGGANVFRLDYFGRPAYLAQSPQFYKQTMVGVFERVYEVGPVFRAEPHDTSRHINQYTSLDVELGFIASHADVMAVLVSVLREMLAEITRTCAGELALLGATLPAVPEAVPEIHFIDAQARLGEDEPDLSPEGERRLGAWAREAFGSDWLFVLGYPMAKRPFYTHPDPERPAHSRSFDLLFRGTELVTGGQRLHRHEDYVAVLAARGMAREPVASYLEVFQNGMPPHGGFAIGLERFLMQLLGLPNIRLATLFPRDLSRLSP